MSDKSQIYKQIWKAWHEAHPDRTKQQNQHDCNEWWNVNKAVNNFGEACEKKLRDLIEVKKKSKGRITQFFKSANTSTITPKASGEDHQDNNITESDDVVIINSSLANSNISQQDSDKIKRPAQEILGQKLTVVNADISSLVTREQVGMLTSEDFQKLKNLKQHKVEVEKSLKALELNRQRQKEFREKKKRALEEVTLDDPELASKLRIRNNKGRPAIIESQPDLLSTIIKIATHGGAADDKRRSEILRTVKTLDELTEELRKQGFTIGRSTVYYHLAPRNIRTIDGKKHVNTVPVRLIKASNDLHKNHPDSKFCTATINNILELASFLGPTQVTLISQDDKAKVPIGLPAATMQAPLLMHLEYKVRLPDHDFVVAARHRLTPSVYAALKIKEKGFGSKDAVSYSGPTYITIRSAKHSSSTAYSHAVDFARLFNLDFFKEIVYGSDGLPKPTLILLVDGGPDENPRYQKVIQVAIHNFIEYSLDTLIIATNAPHRSAFNPVERRMAPLSRQLSGLILPHDAFGSYLVSAGKTIDPELELQNFKHAGECLAEVFSKILIDGYEVLSEFIEENKSEINEESLIKKDETWIVKHVRSSQYMLQISKCTDESCCMAPRGNVFDVLKNRFLPAPVVLKHKPKISISTELPTSDEESDFEFTTLFQSLHFSPDHTPYDQCCASLQKVINERICKTCNIYFASLSLLNNHKKTHPKERKARAPKTKKIVMKKENQVLAVIENDFDDTLEWIELEFLDPEISNTTNETAHLEQSLPIISIEEHLKPLWEEIIEK